MLGTWSPAWAGTFKSSSLVLSKCHLKHLSCSLFQESGGGSVVPLSQIRKVSEQVNTNMISLLAITTQLQKSSKDTQQKHLQISSERGEKEGNTRSNTPTGKKA